MPFRLSLVALLLFNVFALANWPHWLGPLSNGSSSETGLKTAWSSGGPKVLWKAPGGDGYSSIVVVDEKAFTLVQRDQKEVVLALDVNNGAEVWATPIGPAYKNNFGNGPRSTAWHERGQLFVQSVTGPLVCLDAVKGTVNWRRDLLKEFDGKNITWGLSASPVVSGDQVLVVPGGKKGGVAALDAAKGETRWTVGSDKAAYASPVIATVSGERQVIFFNASGLLAVSMAGKELWRQPWKTEFDCNIMTPLFLPPDRLFVSSGESVGCALFKLKASGPPNVVWQSRGAKSVMINYWANPVVHDNHLYGLAGEFSKKIHLRCIDLANGDVRWTKEDFGKGAITLADGHLFITTKKGDLVVAKASPKGYEETARATILGDNRTAPTLSRGRLYLRDLKSIVCLDVKGP